MALGGSTNAVLHLLAMARAFDIELTIDDFQKVREEISCRYFQGGVSFFFLFFFAEICKNCYVECREILELPFVAEQRCLRVVLTSRR